MTTDALLTVNEWSRPGKKLSEVRAIVLHWPMNPGQGPRGIRQWWEDRKGDYGSAHFIVGESETLRTVPEDEVAYHAGTLTPTAFAKKALGTDPNRYAIGIELCHAGMSGKPSAAVWDGAVELVQRLCAKYDVPMHRIVTHWDVVGMQPKWNGLPCHRWFVESPGEMARFRAEVWAL